MRDGGEQIIRKKEIEPPNKAIHEKINPEDEIHFVQVTPEYPHIEYLLDIGEEAFPPNEWLDSRDASNLTKENGYIFLAIENPKEPIGFTLWYDCGDGMVFGSYLAIAQKFRNQHYGTRVIHLLIDEYFKGKILFGCVEALLPEAENYHQRLDRVRLYKRNGLFLLDEVIDGGPFGQYQFVCTDPSMSHEQLLSKFQEFIPYLILSKNSQKQSSWLADLLHCADQP